MSAPDPYANRPPLYIVMTSSAKAPAKARRAYMNVAVIKTDEENWPKMISDRALGCLKIVWHSGRCSTGTGDQNQYARARRYANELADKLNHRHRPLTMAANAAYAAAQTSQGASSA